MSIESVGGKEIHDEALTMGDMHGVLFGLCVLGVRDMKFLWTELDGIACKYGAHCAGDTACAFGNTAMVLAEQKMIPRVFAAVVRAVSAVRSLETIPSSEPEFIDEMMGVLDLNKFVTADYEL